MDVQNIFKKRLITLLEADIKQDISDEEAMKQTLDRGSEPSDFDVNTDINQDETQALQASQDLMSAVSNQNQIMISKLKDWVNNIQQFIEFLNGTSDDSIQSSLTKALPDTLFDKIKTAESKKIARAAVDLASLSEIFKGYLTQQDNARLRGV